MARRDQARWRVLCRVLLDEVPQLVTEDRLVWLDISVIVKTIPTVVGLRGAS